jgi:chromosome segregation ATPase
MKKLFLLPLCLLALVACNNGKKAEERAQHERDSLMQVIDEKETELNDIMGSINEIQEGFRQINEAEGRITVANGNPEAASSRDVIRENMQFIQQTMQQNRDKIAQLKQRLKTTTVNVERLTKTIENLQQQLDEQNRRVQELEAQLAERDVQIAQQGEQISQLSEDVSGLRADNEQQQQTIQAQDQDLHSAWFVFGTKAELKEQKILQKGDVLKNGDFNKDYFTKIDIRIDKEIKLYSKSAEILTNHPSGTYELVRDAKKQYTLKITDPEKFWSTSKYLVIQVK